MKLDFSGLTFIKPLIMQDLASSMEKCNINTPLRAAHFLAQAKEESQDFTHKEENLHYSAARLKVVFPHLFPTDDVANHYAMKPEMIGNRVYANKGGNGDESSGDGFKFRGRGFFELTEKNNYSEFGLFVGEDLILNPDLVATKYCSLSAAWFFEKHGLNSIADQGGNDPAKAVHDITLKINGGLNGITVRTANFKQIFPLIKIITVRTNISV